MPDLRSLVRPTYSWVPDWDFTDGDAVADWSVQALGMTPDGEQQLVLDAMYAGRRAEAGPACFETATLAPRQNLKTALHEVAALADLFLFGDELNLWTAHLFPTARKSFLRMVGLIDAHDDLRRRCRTPRTANGQEAIELLTGPTLGFHARSKGGGRGFAGVGKATLDEALFLVPAEVGAVLPTMATNPYAQVRYASSAGLESSASLRDVRARGRRGGDPGLGYFEWCAPATPCESGAECSHAYGQVEGCALDRADLLALANPALGRRIALDTLQKFRRAMSPREFAREFLGWWDEPETVAARPIDADVWKASAGAGAGRLMPVAFGVTVSPERSQTFVGVAGLRGDGLVQVELVARGAGVVWAVEWLASRVQRYDPCAVVLDGTALPLAVPLADRGVESTTTSSTDRSQATAAFFDSLNAARLRHPGDPTLDNAALTAGSRPMVNGFVWDGPDVGPLVAVTLAVYGLATAEQPLPPPPEPRRAAPRPGWSSETADLASAGF